MTENKIISSVYKNKIRGWEFILLLFTLCFQANTLLHAQDLHFSQYYESPLTLNPALCGQFSGSFYGELNCRTQWSSVMGGSYGYNTMGATTEYHNLLKNWKRGYFSQGLSFFTDKSGDAKIGTTEVAFTMASGIFLNTKNTICAGIQAGLAQRSIDLQNAEWGEQYVNGTYESNAPTGETSIGSSFSYTDFSGGLSYNYSSGDITRTSNNNIKVNLGVAAFHINQPNISYYGAGSQGAALYMRYVTHGYLEFGIPKTSVDLEPGFSYYMQGPSTELNTGITARYYMVQQVGSSGGLGKNANTLDLGIYYRWNDAYIVILGMRLKAYTLGMSYDLNTSPLHIASSGRGAFELSLKYTK